MKKLLPLLLLTILAGCGEKANSEKAESDNILNNLTYSADTVVVDSGNELINLSSSLRLSDVSADRSKMYLYSEREAKLSVIDLDKLLLKEKIPFEKEGPNGVGTSVWNINVISGDNLLISTFRDAGIFNLQGQKLEAIQLNQEKVNGIDENTQLQNNNLRVSQDMQRYYSIPGSVFDIESQMKFAVIDRTSLDGKLMELPALDITLAFTLMLTGKDMIKVSGEDIYLLDQNGRFYISTSATSDLYAFDPKLDSLEVHSFPLQSIPKAKTDPPHQKQLTEEDQWNSEIGKIHTQIKFGPLLWDDSRQYFFRIASLIKPTLDPAIKAKKEVFLLAFDSDMKLVGETLIKGLKDTPESAFFKDGKLWSYVNVEDELGFAVFTFDF
ncbi:hypothetical protein J2X69_004999 [Algoriphagus sp. 4150]|uniref:DUF4221 family protein n=1 Tax=Algoriphagus sp. 4150 TaxID=2817756 RepID=UPI00285E039B|nr:DUF4221 family protein [Algoriphagus sp. 4150]MDR7132625.1 hypothetical protein [Algoriphagus sp. 4150]